MAAFGFVVDDYGDGVEVWPENWLACDLFRAMTTQWRMSMGGPTGLDYGVLFRLLDNARLSGDEWDMAFADVRVMEAAAIETMAKK